jgi:hypothetical protein
MFNGIRLSDDVSSAQPGARKRWGRRFAWGFLILVVAALLGHGIWSLVESAKLSAQIAAIRSGGQPLLPEDFGSANVDSPDNAVIDLTAAGAMLQRQDQTWKDFENLELGLPLRPEEMKLIEAIAIRSKPALDRLAQAENKSIRKWPIDVSDPSNIIQTLLPDLSAIRGLANVLADSALLEHQRGDDQAALQNLQRIFLISRILERNPTLVGHLVCIGCQALAAQRLADISSDLRVGPGAKDASPEQVQQMITTLLEEKSLRDGYVWSMQGERMLELTMVQNILAGAPMTNASTPSGEKPTGWSPITRYAARPLIYHNARIILDQMGKIIALSDAPDWPAADRRVPPAVSGPLPLTFLAQILTPGLGRAVETQFRLITEQHLAATLLALRLYAIDHDGQLPAKLDELVPRYLPAVPTDVLAANSPPVKFLPRANDPIVYSVGQDGVDDGGSEACNRPGRSVAINEWDMKDRVTHVKRQPRPAPQTDEDSVAPSSEPTTNP